MSDQRGVVAVCAVRSGERWTRIEHLALTATAGDGGPDIERDVIAAVVASVPGTELHLSVLEQRPVTSLLLQRGATVVDTAVFMSTASGLLSDRVVVVHSGFG